MSNRKLGINNPLNFKLLICHFSWTVRQEKSEAKGKNGIRQNCKSNADSYL